MAFGDRTILHCDLNNFYASVECKHQPGLKNIPMAVGGDQAARRGVILAKNQLAKKYGIITGEPIIKARQKCPSLTVVPPHRELYEKYSIMVRRIYEKYTDKIEPFGIDECWLDVTDAKKLFGDGKDIADILRKKVKEETGLTISVGVSFNKVFAKLGSDLKKPDATTLILPDNFKEIVWPLPSAELLYVGKNTAKRLSSAGIFTIGDIACSSPELLQKLLGKLGGMLYAYANGFDSSPVEEIGNAPVNKSVGNSVTTPKDLVDDQEVKRLLFEIADGVAARLRKYGEWGSVVHVVIKDADFGMITRQARLENPTNLASVIGGKAYDIFLKNWDWSKNIRMLGVSVSDLSENETVEQLSLFDDPVKNEKMEKIEKSMDEIRGKYGKGSIKRGL